MSQENNKLSAVMDLFDQDADRGRTFSILQHGWLLDYSRMPLDRGMRERLFELPRRSGLRAGVERLFNGALVNPTEAQPALHMQLRAEDAPQELLDERRRVLHLAGQLHSGDAGIDDLLHVGIGGSDLGPRLVADALDENDGRVRVHWLSTLDGRRFRRLLASLDPARTGLVIASKSFSTEETMTQARAARDWMGAGFEGRCWASTANVDRAVAFGLSPDHVLPFPLWTGGRYSLWSSVGVSAAAVIGPERFGRLLQGADEADQQFHRAPDPSTMAVVLALLMHCLRRDLKLPTLGVVAYEPRLALLGDFLQQLVMESLGKGVTLDDKILEESTSALIYGGRGTDLQHSIFQALHQGRDTHPLLLVGSLADPAGEPDWHRRQLAHLLAQAAAFARGRDEGAPHRRLPGQRPVALLLTEQVSPEGLGFLLASFEHAVYALSVFWQINAFDQWGVEEGKRLAADIRERLETRMPPLEDLAGFF